MSSCDILPIMISDHTKLERLLDELDTAIINNDMDWKEAFYHFEWELEKHLFIEEKAIFNYYTPDDVTAGYKMIPKITQHHNYILNTLNNWRDQMKHQQQLTDIAAFKTFLIKHREYEEQELYPRFDEALTDEQKKNVIDRIAQIIEQ